VSYEGANRDAATGGCLEGILEFFKVQAKNQDVDALLGFLDRREKGLDAVVGLYQQLQDRSSIIFRCASL